MYLDRHVCFPGFTEEPRKKPLPMPVLFCSMRCCWLCFTSHGWIHLCLLFFCFLKAVIFMVIATGLFLKTTFNLCWLYL